MCNLNYKIKMFLHVFIFPAFLQTWSHQFPTNHRNDPWTQSLIYSNISKAKQHRRKHKTLYSYRHLHFFAGNHWKSRHDLQRMLPYSICVHMLYMCIINMRQVFMVWNISMVVMVQDNWLISHQSWDPQYHIFMTVLKGAVSSTGAISVFNIERYWGVPAHWIIARGHGKTNQYTSSKYAC